MNLPDVPGARGVVGTLARCLLGLGLMGAALAVSAAIWSYAPPSPFLLVYPAILIAAWLGGWAAGLVAIVVAALALSYWFMPPSDSFAVAARRDVLDLTIFVPLALVLVGLIVRMRRALIEAYEARSVAEKATAAKDTVLAVVAHDLRNPLQTIGMSAEMLSDQIAAGTAGEVTTKRVNRIQRAAERARRLVDNILDSAKIDSTPFPIVPSVVSLSSLLDETIGPFKSLADARHIDLELPAREAMSGSLVCDEDRIVQVLSNLVGNAIQYTPEGGRILVDVQRGPQGVRFDVADNGQGMSKDDLSHSFERLWHGKGPGHGSGLGLWISKALVEAHGGNIHERARTRHANVVRAAAAERGPSSRSARGACACAASIVSGKISTR